MARILIVGCGCRGRELATVLRAHGHAVRGTTRDGRAATAIAASGAEPFVADPDRVGTLLPALDGVAVICLLLGSAAGPAENVQALHAERLEMLLQRSVDTTVRAVAYEAQGTVEPEVLASGAAIVRAACELSRIPYALLEATYSAGQDGWARNTATDLERLLAGGE